MTLTEFPVGIVGAGPVGMALAARLASFGVPSVLLEADIELRRQGSKACLIQGDVLEILDKVNCGETIGDEALTWNVGHTYVGGKEIRTEVYPTGVGFGAFLNLSQYRIEQVLLARLEADPLCDVRWGHRVVGVQQEDEGVDVTAATNDGDASFRFRYLVACDGVRSTMRGLVGVEWTGYSHEDLFLITDIRARLPLAKERHFHYDPPFNPGRQVVMQPQPDDVWRVDWQLSPDTDIEGERESGALDRRVRAVIGDIPYDIIWLSTYRFHQRVVERFLVGRVFFAGDAAHALPPYGARGMNSGIQDADNLAWKLAFVVNGQAAESLLETYHTERHAAARENLAVTEATIRFMVPPSRPRRLARALVLRVAKTLSLLRRHVNSGHMAEPFVYTSSPIVDSQHRHPMNGRLAPDGLVSTPAGRRRIRSLFGRDLVLLCFADGPEEAQRFVDEHLPLTTTLPVQIVLVVPAGTHIDTSSERVIVVQDHDQDLRRDYSAGRRSCVVVRPDGHIAAVLHGETSGPVLREALLRHGRLAGNRTTRAAETADVAV